ncbi:GNAT family N-acetyltransferase [Shewanella sp. WXL01]|uniref:GNAT family N-acetyltransferase n=1 Tax=Shewanella maritima TaxID=2520507 RepID=A0A411PIY1_9GAMM|nr:MULTISPECIES: GNAT family N-acetyltransferase [Shewanella]NKF51221.1 GNAT family N-acetyltransferase [Shewanella sp. WXL01]QBF83536.1 GNAT family N-acetyltransferase [Shewanella maritima]
MLIRQLLPADFQAVITLGNLIHGAGYLNQAELEKIYQQGIKCGVNAHFVALDSQTEELVGFRLTYAPGQWPKDRWCSIAQWGVEFEDVCYFKSNTIAEHARGKGLGGKLLAASIEAVKAQGAKAGVSHLWQQSPNNAAVKYFTKAGGKLIKVHPERWNQRYVGEDYHCVLCGNDCHCDACEMLLKF